MSIIEESESYICKGTPYPFLKNKPNDYTIYKTELNYKKHRNMNVNDIIDYGNTDNIDMDTLEYRFNECKKSGNKILDLSCLELKKLPEKLPEELKYLFISSNEIDVIEDISYLRELKVFECSNNNLEYLPKLPHYVKEISCRSNKLKNMDAVKECNFIQRLDCSHNNINKLPAISTIEILRCAYNNIEHIPAYKNMIKLDCRNNNIRQIESMDNLQILECDKNKLTAINKFPNLTCIYCNSNEITEITDLNKIEVIYCLKNRIEKLPYFYTLKELVCDTTLEKISSQYDVVNALENEWKIRMLYFL